MTRFLLILVIFLSVAAQHTAWAQMPGNSTPEFIPASPWVVGQTQLAQQRGLKGVKLPCVMVNEYNNGFTMRLSGGGRSIMALAVDFRQNIFRQGARYPAVFKTDTGFIQSIKGSAFSPSILIFNMRDANGIYRSLETAKVLSVEIGQNKMRFALGDVGNALRDLESCFNGEGNYPMTMVSSPGQTAGPMQGTSASVPMPDVSQDLPGSFEDITGAQKQAPEFAPPQEDEIYISRRDSHRAAAMKQAGRTSRAASMMKSSASAEANQRPPRQPQPSGNDSLLWTAREGEDMQAVLQRWGAQAGVDVQWQASASQPITQNVTLSGSFENAVQTLLSQNAVMGPLQGQIRDGGGSKTISRGGSGMSPISLTSSPRMSPGLRSSEMGGGRAGANWMAPAGGSLYTVLEQWSSRSNVDLQWFSEQGFMVKQSVAQNGSYEDALRTLLSQYEGDRIRPAVRLNTDPNTGIRVLVVESERL